MRHRRSICGAVIVTAVVFLAQGATADESFKYVEGTHGAGSLRYIDGIPVLTVQGTPEQMGEQIGYHHEGWVIIQ